MDIFTNTEKYNILLSKETADVAIVVAVLRLGLYNII